LCVGGGGVSWLLLWCFWVCGVGYGLVLVFLFLVCLWVWLCLCCVGFCVLGCSIVFLVCCGGGCCGELCFWVFLFGFGFVVFGGVGWVVFCLWLCCLCWLCRGVVEFGVVLLGLMVLFV
jgi:hypothetical protein